MSPRPCPRQFEVEAARDGRLIGRARAAMDLHLASCKECSAEARTLNRLSEALAALPVAGTDAVTARRQRQHLLGAFDRFQVESQDRSVRWRWTVGTRIVAPLVTAAVLVAIHSHRVAPTSTPSHVEWAGDSVVIVPADARWTRSEQGATTRVTLDDGELDIHVKHHAAPHGLVVSLPDGELEDVGTTFHVQVQGGRTVAIRVQEGAVVFRRAQRGAVLLGAGESWSADRLPAAVLAASSPSADGSVTSLLRSPPVGPALAMPEEKAGTLGAAKEFRDAIDLLNTGQGGKAADAFRAYLARHPADGRAEDVAYLLVLALRRAGNEAAASSAAHDYLQRYPHGLRRPEIERLDPSSSASR